MFIFQLISKPVEKEAQDSAHKLPKIEITTRDLDAVFSRHKPYSDIPYTQKEIRILSWGVISDRHNSDRCKLCSELLFQATSKYSANFTSECITDILDFTKTPFESTRQCFEILHNLAISNNPAVIALFTQEHLSTIIEGISVNRGDYETQEKYANLLFHVASTGITQGKGQFPLTEGQLTSLIQALTEFAKFEHLYETDKIPPVDKTLSYLQTLLILFIKQKPLLFTPEHKNSIKAGYQDPNTKEFFEPVMKELEKLQKK